MQNTNLIQHNLFNVLWFPIRLICSKKACFTIDNGNYLNCRSNNYDTIAETKLKQHKLLSTLVCICVQVETCENFSLIRYKSVKMYDILYLGASKLLRYKRDFVICNFAVSVKFIKKYIECLPGIPKYFVISVISL